jgi:hypothetical protein
MTMMKAALGTPSTTNPTQTPTTMRNETATRVQLDFRGGPPSDSPK